jgi:hypothetical protein
MSHGYFYENVYIASFQTNVRILILNCFLTTTCGIIDFVMRQWNLLSLCCCHLYSKEGKESAPFYSWYFCTFSFFFDRASQYIHVMKTNLIHYLSSVYFINQPLHVLGIFVAHHQEVYCIYTTICMCCTFQLTVRWLGWPTDSQLKSTTRTSCCIRTVYLQMWATDMPETCRGWLAK